MLKKTRKAMFFRGMEAIKQKACLSQLKKALIDF